MISKEILPFFSRGELGFIRLGMNESAIRTLLDSPEAATRLKPNYTIFKYGSVEFTFENGELWLIAMNLYSLHPAEELISLPMRLFPSTVTIKFPRVEGDLLSALRAEQIPTALAHERSDQHHRIWEIGACAEVEIDLESNVVSEVFARRDRLRDAPSKNRATIS